MSLRVTVQEPEGELPQVGGGAAPNVKVDRTPGRWRTAARDASSGRFYLVTPEGKKAVLRGFSMTGRETGRSERNSGGGLGSFASDEQPETTNSPTVLGSSDRSAGVFVLRMRAAPEQFHSQKDAVFIIDDRPQPILVSVHASPG